MISVDPKFKKFIDQLIDQAKDSADYLRDQGTTRSENLGGSDAPARFGENNWNAKEVREHFSREGIYKAYIACIEQGKPTNEAIAAKLQGDFLAQLERDYKTSRVTRVRSAFLTASRRAGHGDPEGVIKNGIFKTIENWVTRQGSKPS
jgi:hypothetical protein